MRAHRSRGAGVPGVAGVPGDAGTRVRTAAWPRFVPIHRSLHASGRWARGMRGVGLPKRAAPPCVWGHLNRRGRVVRAVP